MKPYPPIRIEEIARSDASHAPEPARRRFLKIMAASAALAGSGCTQPPPEPILPYVNMPEGMPPGIPVFYATTLVRDGYGHGVLVETNMGRPTKIEGNVLHPASLGATDIYAQAAILQLWDPDRSNSVMQQGRLSTWEALQAAMVPLLHEHASKDGSGMRLLTGNITSPTLLAQIAAWQARYPQARWHRHDPTACKAAQTAALGQFGRPAHAGYRLERARVVLTLDADIFSIEAGSVRYASDFMRARRESSVRSRLYAVEATPGLVGACADDRLALSPVRIEALLWGLAAKLGLADIPEGHGTGTESWESALAEQLAGNRGTSLIVAGRSLSAESHALVWQLNAYLGNIGHTVFAVPEAAAADDLASLVRAAQDGEVQSLIVLDANPVYDAPGSLGFAQALERIPFSVHLGLYHDETGQACGWHVPRVHDLEDWSDALAWDGTASIVQPVIAPLYGGYSPHTLMALLTRDLRLSAHEQVRRTWRERWQAADPLDFEARWRRALRDGVLFDSAAQPLALAADAAPPPFAAAPASPDLSALFVLDPSTIAGGYANNAWLQELPHPLTKLTWGNAALIGTQTAMALGLASEDIAELRTVPDGPMLEVPILVAPGHAEGVVSLPLGYGRSAAGGTGTAVGFDAYPLQLADAGGAPLPSAEIELRRTGRRYAFAITQLQDSTHGADIVKTVAPGQAVPAAPELPSLYPPRESQEYAWAMSIDLDACIGCNACTVACQAENNIPVVGREQVANGREMHWIRVDRYRDVAGGVTAFQPVPCMHCENAPCEVVCPVGATVHDSGGLNVQVYNRCVGTRFCSNNCPYKVRRFNFFEYTDPADPAQQAMRNPEVTVRQRGVMEKCTYCVQRINRARIEAKKAGRRIGDGEVVTACEAACPTRAIVFGDRNDPDSRVRRAQASPRDYALLAELNTRPRTTYLARVIDPQTRLEPGNG